MSPGKDPPARTPPKPRLSAPPSHQYRTPLTVLVLGLLSAALLLWTSHTSEQAVIEDLALGDTVRRLEVSVATAHLWLEEILSGDTSVGIEEIQEDLSHALELVVLVLRGGPSEPGGLALLPLRGPELRRQAESIRQQLVRLTDFSMNRYRLGRLAGVGSDLDQDFDRAFLALLRDCDELRTALSQRTEKSQARARRRLWLVVGVWIVLVLAASAGLFRTEKRRRQAELALRRREAELNQAQKMEAVGRLAGGIAHDINNYLGAIRGFCEVAGMKNPDNPALVRQMDAAMETATEASTLIRQLLAFSRKQPVRPRVVDLNQVVGKMQGMARKLLGGDVLLSIREQPGLWNVEFDPSQVDQVLLNLLVNSRDAMPTGGEIVVRTRNVECPSEGGTDPPGLAPGKYAVLSVHDSGHGISPEIREKIFEPFFTTKSEAGSSGLGLATVYGIVQQNSGFIAVSSEAGQGTTFEIFLPARGQPVGPSERAAEPEALPERRAVKVFLVEDNDHMRASTEALLKALGHDVVTASDAEQALAALAGPDPAVDLLITDVVMPGLSGPQMLERIREKRGNLPCLFISGYTDNVVLRYGLELENADFLQKPFTASLLSRKIGEILTVHDPQRV